MCFFEDVELNTNAKVSICLHKHNSWKWKIPRILVQFQMCFFLDWDVIKHSYKCLSVYINIITTIIFNNLLISFSCKKTFKLSSIYSLFFCPEKSCSSQQKDFNFRPSGAGEAEGVSAPPKFADNVPFFPTSPLNVPFLKIFNLK